MTKTTLLLWFLIAARISGDDIVHEWIKWTLDKCENNDISCDTVDFYEAKLMKMNRFQNILSSWFIVSDGIQGAFYYSSYDDDIEEEDVEGVYVYPDWSSCVSGTWRKHILVQGRYCNISSAVVTNNILRIHTSVINDSPAISYTPPSYADFGAVNTMMDPFENKTVEVKESLIKGAGEGLFTIRNVKAGEFVCFYSGLLLHRNSVLNPMQRRPLTVFQQMETRR